MRSALVLPGQQHFTINILRSFSIACLLCATSFFQRVPWDNFLGIADMNHTGIFQLPCLLILCWLSYDKILLLNLRLHLQSYLHAFDTIVSVSKILRSTFRKYKILWIRKIDDKSIRAAKRVSNTLLYACAFSCDTFALTLCQKKSVSFFFFSTWVPHLKFVLSLTISPLFAL